MDLNIMRVCWMWKVRFLPISLVFVICKKLLLHSIVDLYIMGVCWMWKVKFFPISLAFVICRKLLLHSISHILCNICYDISYVFTHWEETAHSYYINIQAQRFWDFLRAKYTCQIKNSVHDNNSTLDEREGQQGRKRNGKLLMQELNIRCLL